MSTYKAYYRAIFDSFGYPLTDRAKTPVSELSAAEKRLGVKIPTALREYCLVAGRERRFNTCHNRVLAPRHWSLDKNKLIFMEENQTVVWWAVSTRNPQVSDPSVFQGVNDEPIQWARDHRRFSIFLAVMLHYQAVSGGFSCIGSATAPDDLHKKLKKGWRYVGEVNQLWAFSRQYKVVCVTPGMGFQTGMMLLAGGKTRRDVQEIEESLGVTLDID